uniref:5-aminolevulinate synthase, non-specific, mitochondrial n=1 Tax=Otolemur garnettii TaxID=30611 RepID=H0XEG8_OTOGA
METVVRRCPFLSRVPQAFLQKAGKSLLFYAQNCPKMMEAGAKPAPRALSTSTVDCQQIKETSSANAKDKTAKAKVQQAPDRSQQIPDGTQLPSGHPLPAKSQGTASKCPFLAAQMSQSGSSVFCKASLELQEDVQEMHAVRKEVAHTPVNPSMINVKTDGGNSNGLLKNFQDIMRKQRPERVSHLLQDNLPKSVSTFQYDHFFEKKIDEKKNDHTYRVFKTVNRRAHIFPMADDYSDSLITKKQVSVWCSNDYLGMSRHPRVCGAELSLLFGRPGLGLNPPALVYVASALAAELQALNLFSFSFCWGFFFFLARAGFEPTMSGIWGGWHHPLLKFYSCCTLYRFGIKNNTLEYKNGKLFRTVSGHSSGAVCPLEELCDVAHEFGAITFVDEVHAVGLYGAQGGGIGDRDGVMPKMDIISGTLGKAFGCVGGYIASTSSLIDTVRSYAAGFIFTTSLPPMLLAGALESVRILKSAEGRALRRQHQRNVKLMRQMLMDAGLPVVHCPSHIIPVRVADAAKNTEICDELMSRHNIYVQAINYPTVPRGEELLRIAPTPHHTPQMMNYFLENLLITWKQVGLELKPHSSAECNFCRRPLHFEVMSEREKSYFSGLSKLVSAQA